MNDKVVPIVGGGKIPDVSGPNCSECVYVHQKTHLEGGGLECRFNPPTLLAIQQQGGLALVAMFPPVNSTMICGGFEVNIDEPETPVIS